MEDDNISLTSTKETEYCSADEFEVDRILAERGEGDQKRYLLSWLGYEEEKHSWEPDDNLHDEGLLKTWQERKRLEGRGFEKPYDVDRWNKLMEDARKAKEDRRRRRKEKRKRLGMKVSTDRETEPSSEDSEMGEAMEVHSDFEDAPGIELPKKTTFKKSQVFGQQAARGERPREPASSSDESPLAERKHAKAKKVAEKAKKDIPAKDTATYAGNARPEVARQPQVQTLKRPRSRSAPSPDMPLAQKPRQSAEAPKRAFRIPKRAPQTNLPFNGQSNILQNIAAAAPRGGKTATRGGGAVASGRPRNILSASANPDVAPKRFSNMRLGRIAQVRARGIADREPDVESLGEPFIPARPSEFQSLTGADLRHIRTGDEDQGLFMDSDSTARSRKHAPEAFVAPPYLPVSKGPAPDPSHAVCYYFDREQKDPSQGNCVKGYMCPFLHEYRAGVPVAPLPVEKGGSGGLLTCYYWDLNMKLNGIPSCSKGYECSYLHEFRDGVPVAPKPGSRADIYRPETDKDMDHYPSSSNTNYQPQNATVVPPQSFRPPYDSSWGFKAICHAWHEGGCSNDGKCQFVHSNTPDIPFGPKITQKLSEDEINRRKHNIPEITSANDIDLVTRKGNPDYATCYFWDQDGHCSRGPRCNYFHVYRNDAPLAPPPPSISDAFISPTNRCPPASHARRTSVGYKTDVICRYWEIGDCWDGDLCKFQHGNTRHSRNNSSDVPMPDNIPTAPLAARVQNERLIPPLSGTELERRKKHKPETTRANSIITFRDQDKFYATCYEWDMDFECPRHSRCVYLHAYRDDAPLARAPLARLMQGKVCEYWRRQECYRRAEDCAFLHANISEGSSLIRETTGIHPSRINMLHGRSPSPTDDGPVSQPSPPRFQSQSSNIPKHYNGASRITNEEYFLSTDEWKVRQVCLFWDGKGCSKAAHRCEFFHCRAKDIPEIEDRPMLLVNGRWKQPRPCRFWLLQKCMKSPKECEALHFIPNFSNSPPKASPKLRPGDDFLASLNRPVVRRAVTFKDEPTRFKDEPEAISRAPKRNPKDGQNSSDPLIESAHVFSDPIVDPPRRSLSLGGAANSPRGPPLDLPQDPFIENQQLVESPIESSNNFQDDMDLDPVVAPKPKVIVSLKDYRQKSQNKLFLQSKDFMFANSHAIAVDIRHMSQLEQTWAAEFLRLPKIKFASMCMAYDLEHLFISRKMSVLWNSNLAPAKITGTASSTIDLIMNELKGRGSGLVASFSNLIVVVYPVASEWEFLRTTNGIGQQGTKLQFAILEGDLQFQGQKLAPLLAADDIINPAKAVPLRKDLVKRIHNLEFKKLLPTNTAHSYNVFFIFPPGNETKRFLIDWLHASCLSEVKLKIYSSQEEGAWEFFAHKVVAGVVLIHESMAAEISTIPYLMDCTRDKPTTVWYISDSGSPYPAYPSHYTGLEERPLLGTITTTLLFPHGHAFLLTPSFIIAEPKRALETLVWFFRKGGKSEFSMPGTWKLVVCHNFVEYVHDVATTKVQEKEDFERINQNKPAREQMLHDKGLDFATCSARYELHDQLTRLEAAGAFRPSLNGPADELYSPIVYAPPSINPDNEQALVEWFAFWSLTRLDKHRKFTVIGTGDQTRKLAFRGVEEEVPTIRDQVAELITDVQRRGSMHSNDRASVRQSPAQASSGFSPIRSRSARSPLMSSPGSPMDIDSRSKSPEMAEDKVLVFEPTTRWYARLRKSGRTYEHVLVNESEVGLRSIGMVDKKAVVGKK